MHLQFKYILLFCCSHIATWQIQGQELSLTVSGYDMHAELNWSLHPAADRYEIRRKKQQDAEYNLLISTRKLRWIDWTGRETHNPQEYQYFIQALSVTGIVLATSDTITATVAPMSDEAWLDMVQSHTFRYFYDYAHPISGMIRERLGSEDLVTTGGTGFGVMALIVGIERGYITREQGINRMLQLVSFLQFADRFHGVFPHWMHGRTGDVIPFSTFDNGGDLVETAFLMQGLLCARQYFDRNEEKENVLRDVITGLWEDVEWDHYTRNQSGVLYWHWSPDFGWQMNHAIRGYNEALIVYLLAVASPTHPIPPSYYHSGWAGPGYVNGFTWYGHKLFVGPSLGGPLFFAHYSFMGLDPRNIRDAYANYFEQNRNHTLIHRAWCTANPLQHAGYNENCWGLTASDNPWGYLAHAPGATTDNGTITPAAAIPSMPYTPSESLAALKHFYQTYGERLWGEYGFHDAFNPGQDWVASSYLAIDQGPIINMIENYRSGLLWSLFMSNPEIAPALEAVGFTDDIVSVPSVPDQDISWDVYPTISSGTIYLELPREEDMQPYTVTVFSTLGAVIYEENFSSIVPLYLLDLSRVTGLSGWYWVSLRTLHGFAGVRPVWFP